MSTSAPEFRLRDAAVTIYAPSILFSVAEGAATPVIALTAIDRGSSVAAAAAIAGMLGIGSILFNIPAGIMADRIGERHAMVAATGVSVIGLVLCGLPLGLATLALGTFLLGLAASVFGLARQLYLTNTAPPQMRARALSTLGGAARLGMVMGPLLGSAAIALGPLESAFVVAMVAVLAAGGVVLFAPDPAGGGFRDRTPSGATVRSILRDHRTTFLTLSFGVLLLAAVRQARQVTIPLWGDHLGLHPSTTSLIFALSAAVDVALFYPAGSVMDRFGRKFVALPCTLILGTAFLLLPLTHSAMTLGLAGMLIGVGNGLGSGINMTLGADNSPEVGRAVFLGIWREYADVGTGLGPLVVSALTAAVSLGAGVVGIGVLGFASAGIFARWAKNRPD